MVPFSASASRIRRADRPGQVGIAPCAAVVCAMAFNMTKSWIVPSLENRLIYTKYHRKPDFHARWCAAGAWFTGGKVKNDAHSELEFVGCQLSKLTPPPLPKLPITPQSQN